MRKEDFIFYNLRSGQKGNDINIIFPGWKPHDERVVVFSPHDDDGILGPGSLIQGIPLFGGDVHIIIFCNGSGGYSVIEQKYIITAPTKKIKRTNGLCPKKVSLSPSLSNTSQKAIINSELPSKELNTLSRPFQFMQSIPIIIEINKIPIKLK
jgi:hypothetical protein